MPEMLSRQIRRAKRTGIGTTTRTQYSLPEARKARFISTVEHPGDETRTPEHSTQDDHQQTNVKVNNKSYWPSKRIFSGIQPTGVPHLGNYLGALRKWKELQDQKAEPNPKLRRNHKLFYSIVDYHSLTNVERQNPQECAQLTRESFASLLAVGLDPKYSVIFVQSHVGGFHAQLMWILSTIASTGYLSRMTQWKSKLGLTQSASLDDKSARESLRLGLFSYPVLQAADVLLYKADLIPVGEDQVQHIEFARSLARSFNSAFCSGDQESSTPKIPLFPVPQPLVSKPACRIMNLKEPTKKMSKSHQNPATRILITDTKDDIQSKIKNALTDSIDPHISYDPDQRPGVSNLIEILKHATRSDETCETIASQHKDTSLGAFKSLVADEVVKCLEGIRDRYQQVMANNEVETAMMKGVTNATRTAGATISEVNKVVGLYSYREALHKADSQKLTGTRAEALSPDKIRKIQTSDKPRGKLRKITVSDKRNSNKSTEEASSENEQSTAAEKAREGV